MNPLQSGGSISIYNALTLASMLKILNLYEIWFFIVLMAAPSEEVVSEKVSFSRTLNSPQIQNLRGFSTLYTLCP